MATQRKRRSAHDSELIFARVPTGLVRRLDRLADAEMVSRAAALRLLLRRGLMDGSRHQILEG